MTAPATDAGSDGVPAGAATTTGATRRFGAAASAGLVVAAFVLAQLPVFAASVLVEPADTAWDPSLRSEFFDADSYTRWDSYHYLDLAWHGASLFPCTPAQGEWPEGSWCGNAGWFPAYPLAVRALATPGSDDHAEIVAGVWLSRACLAGVLAVVWWWGLGRGRSARHVAALALAALSAGLVYQVAVYPISMATLSMVAAFVLVARNRPFLGGLAAAVGVASHTTGFVVLAAAGAALALDALLTPAGGRAEAWRAALRRGAWFAAPCLAGWAAALAWFEAETGHFRAPYLVQDKYGHGPRFFAAQLLDRAGQVLDPPDNPYVPRSRWPGAQTVLATVTLAAAVSATVLPRARAGWQRLDALDRVLVPAMVVTWLAPLSVGGTFSSQHRLEALLVPTAILARHLPTWAIAVLAAAGAVVGTGMATLYFGGTLG